VSDTDKHSSLSLSNANYSKKGLYNCTKNEVVVVQKERKKDQKKFCLSLLLKQKNKKKIQK
jgi:hypothetical protein